MRRLCFFDFANLATLQILGADQEMQKLVDALSGRWAITQPSDELNRPVAKTTQHNCRDTLDFVSAPGCPSAIRVFALTHSRRIAFQR